MNINDTKFGKCKIQLVMLNNCISSKDFEETSSLYIQKVIQKISLINFLIQFYKDFKKQEKHQMKEEANLFMKMSVYYIIIFIKQT